MPFGIGVYL